MAVSLYTRVACAGLAAGALLLGACSGDDGGESAPTATEAAVPTATTATESVQPGSPVEVAPAAVQLAELPEGFLVADEGYSNQTENTANYERIFQASGSAVFAPVGSSQVGRIENNVILFPAVADADAYVTNSLAGLRGEAGEEFIALTLAQAGTETSNVTIEEGDLALGDDSFAVTGYADTEAGQLALGFIVVRIDRAVTALVITGGEPFDIADLLPLAESSSARLAVIAAG